MLISNGWTGIVKWQQYLNNFNRCLQFNSHIYLICFLLQVKRSVAVAEHSAFRLKESMHEISQLKIQLERLQGRNRTLMEEQVDTIEKERLSIEKQFYTQTKHLREEMEKQVVEVGRLKSQIEQQQRTGKQNYFN